MLANRSMPRCPVAPVLAYEDVGAAVDWLCAAFGFTERWRAGSHRAQLAVGDAAIVVSARRGDDSSEAPGPELRRSRGRDAGSVMVRVEDVDAHHEHARKQGAGILQPPADYPYGERQYTAEDLAGHLWTFSQSIADVAPEEWGGTTRM